MDTGDSAESGARWMILDPAGPVSSENVDAKPIFSPGRKPAGQWNDMQM